MNTQLNPNASYFKPKPHLEEDKALSTQNDNSLITCMRTANILAGPNTKNLVMFLSTNSRVRSILKVHAKME